MNPQRRPLNLALPDAIAKNDAVTMPYGAKLKQAIGGRWADKSCHSAPPLDTHNPPVVDPIASLLPLPSATKAWR